MEDMHIHLKDAIYDQLLFNKYVSKCIDMNLSKVVFLDHGNRISPKHKAVLNTKEAIDSFSSLINEYRNNNLNKLEIIKGIEIDYSNDQSIISIKNNKLLLIKGSQYMKYEDKELFIDDNNDEIEIKYIINLVGMCDRGNLSFLEITNKDHIVKSLFKRITWHSDIPLFTSPIMLNIDRNKIFSFLSKINIPVYNTRGDKESLINKIKEML